MIVVVVDKNVNFKRIVWAKRIQGKFYQLSNKECFIDNGARFKFLFGLFSLPIIMESKFVPIPKDIAKNGDLGQEGEEL